MQNKRYHDPSWLAEKIATMPDGLQKERFRQLHKEALQASTDHAYNVVQKQQATKNSKKKAKTKKVLKKHTITSSIPRTCIVEEKNQGELPLYFTAHGYHDFCLPELKQALAEQPENTQANIDSYFTFLGRATQLTQHQYIDALLIDAGIEPTKRILERDSLP